MAFASWRKQSDYRRLRHIHSTPAAWLLHATLHSLWVTWRLHQQSEKMQKSNIPCGPTATVSRGHSMPTCMTSVGTTRFQSRLHCNLQLFINAWVKAGADSLLRTLGLTSAATKSNCIPTKECYRAMAMADITVIDLLVHDTKYTQHKALGFFLVPPGNSCASVASRTKKFLPITSVFVH